MREAGLPTPAANVPVAGLEVDFLWPAARLVVELDGYAHHRSRARFERDRERVTRIQLAGYRVLPLIARRLTTGPALSDLRKSPPRAQLSSPPAVTEAGTRDRRGPNATRSDAGERSKE